MRVPLAVPGVVWLALVGLLVLQATTPGQFGDPAASYRLVAYPLLTLLPAAGWWLLRRSRGQPPYTGFTLVMLPFVVDTLSNVLDLYRSVPWWDDLNHVTNWFLLCAGLGLVLLRQVRPAWALVLLIAGLGAALSVAWELGEWATFYEPPYSSRLYGDTLADQTLGSLGALVAGLVVGWGARTRRDERVPPPA